MRRARPAMVAASLLLSGCAGFGELAPEAAGLGAGPGAGVLTANPLIGVAVAMVARFATAEAVGWVESEQRERVQQAIATAGGSAAPNVVVPWTTAPETLFDTLYGTLEGHLEVIRAFGGLIACRELLYSVAKRKGEVEGTLDATERDIEAVDAPAPPPQTNGAWPDTEKATVLAAVICDGGQGWRWAVSRPAAQSTW